MKKCIVILLLLHLICSSTTAQNDFPDTLISLKQKLNNLKDDTTRVQTLIAIANSFGVDRPDSSLFYFLKSGQLSREIGYHQGELRSLLGLEITLRHNGNLPRAFSTAYKGLKLAKQYQQPYYRAQFLGELGIVEGELENYNRALQLLRESQTLHDSINEPELAIYQWNNMGEVYLKQGNLDSALFYCRAAFDAQTPINFWIDYYSSVNLGKIYLRRQQYDLALSYFQKSADMGAFFSHKFNSNLSIATAFNFLNRPDSCLHYATRAMDIARKSHIFSQLVEANSFFAALNQAQDPEKALQFARSALSYKDSLNRFAEGLVMESYYEFDEQERQYEIKNAQAVYQYEFRQYALLAGLGVVLIIAGILLVNNKQKQRANKLLSQQKEEISMQRQKTEDTLNELKATQMQLIQSAKMASLGELTAGIAHEIQNPLNFVNNFSDVNKELTIELESELDKENISEAKLLAADIRENEEKINHHGKRADAIVKNMLQHSHAATGVKEPADINALADEYLRLAYHGMRGKDKSFNATLKTDFDLTIGNINIIPQDIGRVILNLITNAFYSVSERASAIASASANASADKLAKAEAKQLSDITREESATADSVSEKKKNIEEGYEPSVLITTKKLDSGVEIKVTDNGNGIPQKALDKIFQPFFTTRPTGQGTGLGLSLSYDIVKAHGGEINVETQEGEGSKFTVFIPTNQ